MDAKGQDFQIESTNPLRRTAGIDPQQSGNIFDSCATHGVDHLSAGMLINQTLIR